MSASDDNPLDRAFTEHRRFLWGLSYRMTGSAADADDVVQETFVRALAHPPADDSASWRPWLTRVALNLNHDLLRQRRRRSYVGPWLPSPIETSDEFSVRAFEPEASDGRTTEGRYDLIESVSFAFLLALEALTPRQRAVFLLREVFDYSVEDAARALDCSSATVKTTHHRARRAMTAYDRARCRPTRGYRERVRQAVAGLFEALARGDLAAVQAALAADAIALSDGGGEFHAARRPIRGAVQVAKFYSKIFALRHRHSSSEIRMVNGVPALLSWFWDDAPGAPPRSVTAFDVDDSGRIRCLYTIVSSRKLAAIPFDSPLTSRNA